MEDKIFSILLLWYYGTRKLQQDKQGEKAMLTSRELLRFFGGKTNSTEWAGCTEAYTTLKKGFSGQNFFDLYGKEKSELAEDKQNKLIRGHFSKVLAAGIPELANQVNDSTVEDEELD